MADICVMEPIPPMTLGNMRANGVRSLSVYCIAGHHEAVLDVERWPDHVLVPLVSHPLRDDRRTRPAELEGAAPARKSDRYSMAKLLKLAAKARGATGAMGRVPRRHQGQMDWHRRGAHRRCRNQGGRALTERPHYAM